MWVNYITYILINVINVYCLSTFTTVTSSKTDNAVFIYPGQVNNFFQHSIYNANILIIVSIFIYLLRRKVKEI